MAIITQRLLSFIAALTPVLILVLMQGTAVLAQEAAPVDPRTATGGAQTLEDILARQRGEAVDYDFRRAATGDPAGAAPMTGQLGTLGGVSDPELWRALRYGTADVTVSSHGPAAAVIIQDSGMTWLTFREGPLATYGGYLLLGVLGALLLFYLLRGRIRIDGEKAGITILRFSAIERFAHWLLAGSFVLLGITGLTMLFGRMAIIPLLGKQAYAPYAIAGKWVHNNVSWAFMLGLVLVTVFWLAHNIPNRHDLKWLALGGGLFSKNVHPPAKKFNAGQKIIFWGVLVLGVSISVSGLSLLFPFQMPLFAATFEKLNALGLPQLVGLGDLPTTLLPHQEMQLAQLWHAIVAFLFIAIILAHIYLGTVGMEGAFDAMGSGEVDEQWAKEHHGLWYEDVTGKPAHDPAGHPAE
ncbi:formate dehydrogenase subunit gamma [Antarcticimicrobium luteum]|uniref:Formate dehydrogenase subunit gamma n=1 Tax=Antarcticimicrobium luteum TaxID=2547397 RepID=A0A4R5VCX0_9RHOB|nr:formate dehydrogenase subunit gamma [Antarcticimicrobium luteum]